MTGQNLFSCLASTYFAVAASNIDRKAKLYCRAPSAAKRFLEASILKRRLTSCEFCSATAILGIITSLCSLQRISSFALLRACCTSFFMDLVSSYCFNENADSPPQSDLISLFMSLVTLCDTDKRAITRAFSPFHVDVVDKSPVVRSFLLQLLLRYR